MVVRYWYTTRLIVLGSYERGNREVFDYIGIIIGNYREGLFHPTSPYPIYYHGFGESSDTDKNVLTYDDELVDTKSETVDKAYIEALGNYIGAEILLSIKDAITVLSKV